MRVWIRDVDQLLRGSFTRREDLAEGRFSVPLRTLVTAGFVLGAVYGAFMGLYALLRPGSPSVEQLFATMVKVPLLFLLTLAVTLPSLYVFSALSSSRLGSLDTLRLLLAAVVVDLAVLASFGPVTGFFTLSTESYPFMVVLNVLLFAIAGCVGIWFLWRALGHLFDSAVPARTGTGYSSEDDDSKPKPVPPRRTGGEPRIVLRIWIVIYSLVGAQMGWILRPFVGSPDLPFELFRERQGNFFQAVIGALQRLLVD